MKGSEKRDAGTIDEVLSLVLEKLDAMSEFNIETRKENVGQKQFKKKQNDYVDLYDWNEHNAISRDISSGINELKIKTSDLRKASTLDKMKLMAKTTDFMNQVYDADNILTQNEYRNYISQLHEMEDRIKASQENYNL